MRLLIIDFDGYGSWLERSVAAQEQVVVLRSSFENGLSDFAAFRPDAIIVEVVPRSGDDVMFNFQISGQLYKRTDDRPGMMCVYSAMDRDEFVRTARMTGSGLERVPFFSKAALEIPPKLQCIRDDIVHHPDLIGGSWLRRIPEVITSEWISQHEGVYPLLCEWILKRARARGAEFREHLEVESPGIAGVWHVFYIVGRIENAGMLEAVACGITDDGCDINVDKAACAMRAFGCGDCADVVDAAAILWRRTLRSLGVSGLGDDQASAFISCGVGSRSRVPDSVEVELRQREDEFYELQSTLSPRISKYIRQHPMEFVSE